MVLMFRADITDDIENKSIEKLKPGISYDFKLRLMEFSEHFWRWRRNLLAPLPESPKRPAFASASTSLVIFEIISRAINIDFF